MNGEIKKYIINNFKNDDKSEIKNAIEDSINTNDDVTLPGLGIFFLLNWNEANDKEKDSIVDRIFNQINLFRVTS